MSFPLYLARLKCLIRNKENMFWSFLFPILLATCFFFAFENIWSLDSFKTINIAYDNEGAETDYLKEALLEAETSDGSKLFSVTFTEKESASKRLENKEIVAYIVGNTTPALYVRDSGMNETIIKSFLDSYMRTNAVTESILSNNQDALSHGLLEDISQRKHYVYELQNQKNPDTTLIYFYSLLAFTCIFASNWGLAEVVNIQANQSIQGARVNTSPIHKMKLFLHNLLASFTAQMGSIFVLLFYMYFILGIDFGNSFGYILLTCIVGSLAGLTLGAFVGVSLKVKPSIKEAILTSITLFGGFLSGMMYHDMKFIISIYLPALEYINPVSLVTDALYSLYFYDTLERYLLNITVLSIMSIFFGTMSYFGLRRRTYASI